MTTMDMLIEVLWDDSKRTWRVRARESGNADWDIYDGHEDDLDDLLAIARDIATGG